MSLHNFYKFVWYGSVLVRLDQTELKAKVNQIHILLVGINFAEISRVWHLLKIQNAHHFLYKLYMPQKQVCSFIYNLIQWKMVTIIQISRNSFSTFNLIKLTPVLAHTQRFDLTRHLIIVIFVVNIDCGKNVFLWQVLRYVDSNMCILKVQRTSTWKIEKIICSLYLSNSFNKNKNFLFVCFFVCLFDCWIKLYEQSILK